MSGWLEFEGRIEAVEMGRATYTVIPLPPEVAEGLGAAKRVEAEVEEHPADLAVSRISYVEGPFLWAGQTLLDRIGAGPGARVAVRLRPAAADAPVEVPPDLLAALASAGALALWQGLTPGRQRGLLYRIATAKRAETRAKRIAEVIAELTGGAA